jgi:hypothetical protein
MDKLIKDVKLLLQCYFAPWFCIDEIVEVADL